MVHLNEEALSELLDGEVVAGAEEHLTSCPTCQGELEVLRRLRAELRELPELEPPVGLWSAVEARLPQSAGLRRRLRPGRVALQAAAMAAVFVIGLGLGRAFFAGGPEGSATPEFAAKGPAATSLVGAMAEVRRLGADYDAALRNLEQLAGEQGVPLPSLAEQRLAGLEMLVEATRTALSVEPADPVLNSYLFAALDEREAVIRQLSASREPDSEVLWR